MFKTNAALTNKLYTQEVAEYLYNSYQAGTWLNQTPNNLHLLIIAAAFGEPTNNRGQITLNAEGTRLVETFAGLNHPAWA